MINPKLVRVGDQYMLLFDPAILKALKIHANTPLHLEVDGDKLIITPVREERVKCQNPELQKLLEEVLEEYSEAFQRLADS
jgi:antitoxin component of MazEF toxin-antitoxin module